MEKSKYNPLGWMICLALFVAVVARGDTLLLQMAGGFACLIGFLATFANWFMGKRSEDRMREMSMDPYGPKNTLFELRQMDPEIQQSIVAQRIAVEVIPNIDGPSRTFRFRNGDDSYYEPTVRAVWELASPEHGMPSLRTFGDGTSQRKCAEAMTQYFITFNWCVPARGNQSAQFTPNGYDFARRSLFGGG